ncbi:nucleotide-binding protein [Stenotrophomonas sp.]|uniref:nucleotide-binding protein n=1 Tax=Stenotrophomonas sp. TaxID=69392 RepID=UPI0028A10B61|nr:nucleotide-binding protein [Stenotrophomonas sp.]
MDGIGIAMAKLAGIRKALSLALEEEKRGNPKPTWTMEEVMPYFTSMHRQMESLRKSHPDLFDDIPDVGCVPRAVNAINGIPSGHFHRSQLEHLMRTIDQVFEIRANCELTMPPASARPEARRVFLTHGRAQDWRQIQAFIEKDLGLATMELAQEASGGATIIEKLERASAECDSAVIVMTGDDTSGSGEARTRENVMHEIGYFHGRYGRTRVVLLHEDGVSVPTNLSGIVYVPFPKGLITTAESTLARELRAIYGAP